MLKPTTSVVDVRVAKPSPKKVDPELNTPAYRAWAEQVKSRSGYRCDWIEDGRRCPRSRAAGDRMIADHIVERKDGGALLDPRNGQCLCVQHNTLKGAAARAARMAAKF